MKQDFRVIQRDKFRQANAKAAERLGVAVLSFILGVLVD